MNQSTKGRTIRRPSLDHVIELVWLIIIFVIPLFINPWALNAFYFVKSLVLVLLVCLMLGLVIAQWIIKPRRIEPVPPARLIRRYPLQIAAAVFGLVWVVSTIFSIMPYKSLWGNLAGTVGLLTNVSWILFFIIVALKVRSRSQLVRVLYVLLISSGLVALLGVLQYIDPHVLPWFRFETRVFSTDGNPLSLSAYLAMVLPVTLAMIILTWYGSPSQPKNKIIFTGLLVLFFLQLGCLALAQYSVTILLFIVGIFCFFALIGLFLQKKATVALSIVFLLVIAVIAGILLGPMLVPQAEQVDSTTQGSIISTAEQVGLPTLSIRVDAWKGAAQIILQSPEIPYYSDRFHWLRRAIGYGPETLIAVAQATFPAALRSQYTFDSLVIAQPENHYLYLGVTIGIVGLLAFLAVISIFAVIAFRALWRSKDRETIILLSAFIAAVAQYCLHIFFNASVIDPELVLWTVLGLTVALTGMPASVPAVENISPALSRTGPARWLAAILVVLVFVAAGLWLIMPPLVANMKVQSGLTLWSKDKYAALELYEDATRIQPHQSYYYNFVGNLAYVMAQQAKDVPEREKLLLTSESAYQNAIQQEPQMAIWYYRLADIDVYWAANGNESKYSDAFDLYEKASRLFPGNAVILNKWAFALTLMGDYAGALSKLREAAVSDPSWVQTSYLEGLVQGLMGNSSRASEMFLTPRTDTFYTMRYFVNFCSLSAGYGKAPVIRDVLKGSVENGSSGWVTYTYLGVADVYSGHFDEAIQAFRLSAAAVPENNRLLLAGTIQAMFSDNQEFRPMARQIVDTLVGGNAPSK
jgi:tetratricopeptide (TPR) repeat protein